MVPRHDIQSLADALAAQFPSVERIILFGSYAYGTPDDDSDVDLLVVMEYAGSQLDQGVKLWAATRPWFSCDMVPVTPSELRRRYAQGNTLVGDAMDRGVLLYDRRGARVAQ